MVVNRDNDRGDNGMKPLTREIKVERPEREKVDRKEALKRVKAFPKRKEKLIASIREVTH